ncbi:hypothetical protein [Niallia sp. 03133]|uniref:hypothetical protein n=1 Tax=Niallia sp. 03133 TaxID=3458060 RepID=UPI0040450D88
MLIKFAPWRMKEAVSLFFSAEQPEYTKTPMGLAGQTRRLDARPMESEVFAGCELALLIRKDKTPLTTNKIHLSYSVLLFAKKKHTVRFSLNGNRTVCSSVI